MLFPCLAVTAYHVILILSITCDRAFLGWPDFYFSHCCPFYSLLCHFLLHSSLQHFLLQHSPLVPFIMDQVYCLLPGQIYYRCCGVKYPAGSACHVLVHAPSAFTYPAINYHASVIPHCVWFHTELTLRPVSVWTVEVNVSPVAARWAERGRANLGEAVYSVSPTFET